jgi:6-phosphogluconolactonase
MNGQLKVVGSVTALQQEAAELIVTCLTEETRGHGVASFVLSGGSTPRGVYELLGSAQYRGRIDWKNVHLFWGDERCVGPTRPESNYRMANESLIRHIAIPPQNVHRTRGEIKPQEAARESESDVRRFFGLKEGEFPRFTLVLLGIGEDGHTASLFPGTPVMEEKRRIVADVYVEALAASRVTLTIPAFNNAATVVFLASGRTKAEILKNVLEDGEVRYPAQRINPASGRLFWLVDKDAASRLPKAEAP